MCVCLLWMQSNTTHFFTTKTGKGRYKLMAADLVATNSMMDHIGRFLPSVRMNGAAFSFVVDLIINYGSPVLHLVMVSVTSLRCGQSEKRLRKSESNDEIYNNLYAHNHTKPGVLD